MEKKSFNNNFHYLQWEISNPKGKVVIAHGMAEHPYRYDYLAANLNKAGYDVYALFHLGHGNPYHDQLGHFEKKGFEQCVDNLHALIAHLKKEQPEVKVYLLGHSMGSFMGQEYLSKYGSSLDGLILSGSTLPGLLIKSGYLLASIIYLFSFDKSKKSKLLDNLSFGSYNKNFMPARTKFDWLSQDQAVVDNYINDIYCGYICSVGFFKSFLKGVSSLQQKKKNKKIDKKIPVILLGGSLDPVSNNGEGLRRLYTLYDDKLKMEDVTLKIYLEARHEIYNEINRDEVINDTIIWLDKHN